MTLDALGRLKGREAVAPPLLWSEVTSVLHDLRWRGAISRELADIAFLNFRSAEIALRRPSRLYEEAWAVATRRGWAKTYDAEYVALAQILHCPLLTIDGRLARGVADLIEVIGPTDLEG